jgi:hypothetical protein
MYGQGSGGAIHMDVVPVENLSGLVARERDRKRE